jgi:hypothetical protein
VIFGQQLQDSSPDRFAVLRSMLRLFVYPDGDEPAIGNQDLKTADFGWTKQFNRQLHPDCPPDVMQFGVLVGGQDSGREFKMRFSFTHIPLSFLSRGRVGRICDNASCQAAYYS